MNKITRFQITGLHGYKNVDLRLKDNTLILVGENGAGKTTVLRLLHYLVSGQWMLLRQFEFETLSITLGAKTYKLTSEELGETLTNIDTRMLRDLPPSIRRRMARAWDSGDYDEVRHMCERHDIPLAYVRGTIEVPSLFSDEPQQEIHRLLEKIRKSFDAQILYLPTYRRIEQELSAIVDFKESGTRYRREHPRSRDRETENSYVELIEFGMGDVECAVNKALATLKEFARETLNTLTLGYLGDVVERKYANVDTADIRNAPDETITNVLGRIQKDIFSKAAKKQLSEVIQKVKNGVELNVHAEVICHYFVKLLGFQKELEEKEQRIKSFCRVCNEYMEGKKEFRYDTSTFVFSIRAIKLDHSETDVEFKDLSSGEKQIVSLFSHLYLSRREKFFVLIDEPELSLSVPWQRRFLCDIKNGEFCTGLVAVTHSPFIYDNELKEYAHSIGEFIKESR